MLRTLAAAVLAFTSTSPASSQQLAPGALSDPTEKQIVTSIEARYEQDLALLTKTVDINSGTMNLAGVREVGEVFEREFRALGFATRWVEGESFGRAGHLIAEWAPTQDSGDGLRFLLIGHLDTVFEADSPFQEMEVAEVDGRSIAKGPGTIDMKGGIVVMLSALHGLESAGVLDEMRVTVFLAGDEERPGSPLEAARAALLDLATRADVALGFEDGDGDPTTAVIARRGSSGWRIDVEGVRAHSSQVFQPGVGAGAIYEAARILDAFRIELADLDNLTYSPGLILGGTDVEFDSELARGRTYGKNNVVPRSAVITGDIRAVTPEQLTEAQERMSRIVGDSLPGTRARLHFDDGYPPMAASEGNLRLLEFYSLASQDLGTGPVEAVDPRNAGAADVAFVAGEVDMALDGLGLMGTGGHSVDEAADLSTLSSQASRAAITMLRLQRTPPQPRR